MPRRSALNTSTRKDQRDYPQISASERQILRQLADKVAELAARPIEIEKRKRWYDHNMLKPTRPVIFCDPEHGWDEILPAAQLQCEHQLARNWELSLKKEIFWGEKMGDDRPVEPFFNVFYTYTESDWGMHETKIGGNSGGSYTWDAPLKDYTTDFARLKFPQITVDYLMTCRIQELAQELFDDLLTVRIKGGWWWSLGMTWVLILLRGLENFMLDFYENPKQLHQLMAFLRDGHLAKLDFLESNELLNLNNQDSYVGSGGFGYTYELPQSDFTGKVRTQDLWGFAESQETVSVSPAQFDEFIFTYQLPILQRFGLNCYGCCEPVDSRWHVIERIPNLRRISVSPWSNPAKMAEFLGNRYVYSRKPNPADLALPHLEHEKIRRELREFIQLTKNCRVEIIMKDNHTIGGNPQNVIDWCRIAKEEAESC